MPQLRHLMDFRGKPRPTNPAIPALASSRQRKRVPVLTMLMGEMAGRLFRIDNEAVVIGRLPACEIQLSDGGVSRMHARLEISALGVEVVDLNSTNGTFVDGERVTRRSLKDGDKLQIGSIAVLRFNQQDELDQAFHQQQFEKMTRDPLTGCHNRLYFDEELRRESAFAKRKDAHLSLALIDVDHFKRINDTHGHGVGDVVLRQLSQILYGQLRTYDVLGRYGGEEFVALLRDAELSGARIVAERLRAAVAERPFHVDGVDIQVSVSIGVAAAVEVNQRDPQAVLRLSDHRLYAAKRDGRNRVVSVGCEDAKHRTEPVDQLAARAAIAARRAALTRTSPGQSSTDSSERQAVATETVVHVDIEAKRRRAARSSAHATTIMRPLDSETPPPTEVDEGA